MHVFFDVPIVLWRQIPDVHLEGAKQMRVYPKKQKQTYKKRKF
jgi:hypothetical protein